MYRIIKIGMDVHTVNYTLCAMEPVIGADDRIFATIQVTPDYKNILMFIEKLKQKLGLNDEYSIECGYEAGGLGYSLYNQLTSAGVKCVILAPTTMLTPQGNRIKTDARDARMIAQCLAYGGYKAVYVPDKDDAAVRDYLRMRDDHKEAIKKLKQQILAFILRLGLQYTGTNWTNKHLVWLRTLDLSPMDRETLDEYLASYEEYDSKINRFDARIEEITNQPKYEESVRKLGCFLGIKPHSALSLIVETGDFARFRKGNIYAAYLGLAPNEKSSGNSKHRFGITKAGNTHLRKVLVEASQGICKGTTGYKSKVLRARQRGNTAEVITYADKANVRMRSKYYRLIRHGKKKNVAVTAIARELACFVWGMMTDNISNYKECIESVHSNTPVALDRTC